MWADRCPRPGPFRVLLVVVASLVFVARPGSGQEADPLLPDFEVLGCLAGDREAMVEQLAALRTHHVSEVEQRGYRRAWRRLRRDLRDASDDGRALVEAWLDSPEVARRLFLCEDGLPLPPDGVEHGDFAALALHDLAGRWWQEEARLAGPDRDREGAASSLDERRRMLIQRFDATYDNRKPAVVVARADLVDRLQAFDEAHVEPWHLGLDAEGTRVHFEPDPLELGLAVDSVTMAQAVKTLPILGRFIAWFEALLPQPPDMSPPVPFAHMDYEPGVRRPLMPGTGLLRGNVATEASSLPQMGTGVDSQSVVVGKIPDPKDMVEIIRTEAGWARQREALRKEIRGEERRLATLEQQLDRSGTTGAELDRLARDVERSRRRLSRLSEDTRRYMIQVQEHQANRPWVTGLLGASKQGAVDGLERTDRRAVRRLEEAREVVETTVARGATRPGTGLGAGEGGYTGPPRPGGTTVASGSDFGSGSADGGGGVGEIDGGGEDRDGEIDGAVEEGPAVPEGAITWEGPLPPPSASWERGLVRELLDAHPELDAIDVRILLGLIARALGPEGEPDAVVVLVRGLLAEHGRLELRGGEAQLSELYRPGLLESEQAEVVFVLQVQRQ